MTTPPLPRTAKEGVVDPFDPNFSAFVFKIQANMNKAHRDRIAFIRLCSGKFEKGMEVCHVQENYKKMRLSQPQQLMAQEREIIDEAYAGDIIGVFDPGTMGRKQFVKGISQIAQEGAIQIFREPDHGMEEVIVGVVGTLQFDVLKYRLKSEYNVEIRMDTLPYELIRWVENDEEDFDLRKLSLTRDTKIVEDLKGRKLLLFASDWNINWALEKNPALRLAEFSRN